MSAGPGEQPFLYRVSFDLSKRAAAMGAVAADMQMTMVQDFSGWKIDASIPDETFVFNAPADAEKVDSFLDGGFGGPEPLSPLLGEPAPPVELDLLQEGEFDLADYQGKKIVMLDFWATWCGPCVEEMPILAEVAEEFADKGVVFCAVNQAEEKEEIDRFLSEHNLEITVALDTEGQVGDSYGVEGIPTLVLIDKKGVVQSVHVGYSPGIKKTLREELTAMLDGKDLAAEAQARFQAEQEERQAELPPTEGLETAWSQAGPFSGAVADKKSAIYAVARGGKLAVYNLAGEKQRELSTGLSEVGTIRRAKLQADNPTSLLVFGTWGHSVSAVASDGTVLWTESKGEGIDDVWPVDLDGDGLDEVIIGYNGGTGLHVLDHLGKPRWKYTNIGNVWHVCAGDVNGDGKVEVVSTSAEGRVHVFSADGKVLEKWKVPLYANMVRVGRVRPDDPAATVFVSGSANAGDTLLALDSQGQEIWQAPYPKGIDHCDSAAVSSRRPWIAVGLRGGLVQVFDTISGKRVASVSDQGTSPEVTWCEVEGAQPLLLVATGRQLNAYRVTPESNSDETATVADPETQPSETPTDSTP